MRFFTIGHSNHTTEQLVELLRLHRVTAVVDVRSQPYSRFAVQFNRELLKVDLEAQGIAYVFLGDLLGGRPDAKDLYFPDGRVDYERLRRCAPFITGIERLEQGADDYDIAIMCSEGDAASCHRHHAISKTLVDRGHEVQHIMPDGALVDEATLQERERAQKVEQMSMFAGEESAEWNSTPSGSLRSQQRSSSSR